MPNVKGNAFQIAGARATLRRLASLPVTALFCACTKTALAEQCGVHTSLRAGNDLAAMAGQSWLSADYLIPMTGVLLALVIGIGFRSWRLGKKVHRQTTAITEHIESEAQLGRRNAQLEQRRSRILEDINGTRPLTEIIEQITEMVSFNLNGAPCWCAPSSGPRLGKFPTDGQGLRVVRRDIPARTGSPLGTLFAAFRSVDEAGGPEAELEALAAGAQLATLAIETRRITSDLVHRSEFDLLTDVYNRASLERFLEKEITAARERESIFGLIYVDLDDFKIVNDTYGLHIGDLYLREVSQRMKRQLRSGDMLARLCGDEFAALVPVVRSRADTEEIALRLERCLDAPYSVEGYVLRGAASVGIAIYPENGATTDKLLIAADAAMSAVKLAKRRAVDSLANLNLSSGLGPRG